MKFGQNLHQYQVVEWTPFYIDYKSLKRFHKVATKIAADRGEEADFTEFTAVLERNLTKAESFYKTRHSIIQQRVSMLHDHYGVTELTAFDSANRLEIEDLTAAFIELRDALKQLQWYELVNFNKIVGRLAKFEGRVTWPRGSNGLRIPDTHLAIRIECLKSLRYVNDVLARLQSKRAEARPGATKLSLLQQKYYDELLAPLPLIRASSTIDRDDASTLDQIFEQYVRDQKPDRCNQQRLILALLHLSTLSGSKRCTERLLARIGSFEDFDNHIHWLVIKTGRKKKFHGQQIQAQNTSETMILSTAVTEAIEQLVHIIRRLGFQLTTELHRKDSFGRLPLHHAVQYGMLEVCQEILKYMKGYEVDHSSIASSSALTPDSEGVTALDLAVLTGNAAIMEVLLEDHRHSADAGTNPNTSQVGSLPGRLLTTALKSGSFTIVRLLRTSVIDVNYKDYHDETALYLAVRSGRLEYVNFLLAEPDEKDKIDVDAPEAVYGWTPLILACVKGDLPVVERLLRAGADPRVRDLFGWTAEDHAAFRGYLSMARMLMVLGSGSNKESARFNNALHQEKQHIRKGSQSLDYPVSGSLGQDTPPGYSQVYVNLGPLDTYNPVTAVNLSPYVSPDTYNAQREADFQVEICGIDGDQSSHVIQLPILEDLANKPCRFVTENAGNFKLAFNIFHADTATHERGPLIGTAVALLESLKQGLGSTRESLIRDFTIPILRKDTLKFIGTVTFYFVVITPFPHPCPMSVERQELEFGKHDSPTIIGHRGIGQNNPSRRQLQIGENTIEVIGTHIKSEHIGTDKHAVISVGYESGSVVYRVRYIISTAVPFFVLMKEDVQLTKDHVPVIYHDFLMSETGIDAPLHSLSLEQFMYISEAQSTLADLPSLAEKRYLERCGDKLVNGYRSRSYSLNVYEQSRAKSLVERMKHTYEFKLNEYKGYDSYKGNIRSEYIQASFMTLEELFVKLPESVRFDIEIKYPMLFEAHDWKMDTYAVELNHLVDTVLDKVYRLAGNRTIFLSSFSPEICILLSTKQNVYPVFFLTESGHIISADARADSLQEAIHFAKSWRLPGVICRSQPLVISPDLVRYVKDSGLLCISWGELNDEPEHAKTQADAGLDAIIINSVNLIARTLRKN